MKTLTVKRVVIELSDEEKETIENTRKIIQSLMDIMAKNNCNWIECNADYGENSQHYINSLDDIDTMLCDIKAIVEIL